MQEHAAALTVEAQRLSDDLGRRQERDGLAADGKAHRDELGPWWNAWQLQQGSK